MIKRLLSLWLILTLSVGHAQVTTNSTVTGVPTGSATATTSTNIAGGVAGSVPYQSAADTTTFLGIGSANTIAVSNGSAPTWTSTLTLPTITNYIETAYVPAAGSAFTVSLANGTIQQLTTNANVTITLPTPAAGKAYTIQVAYGGTHTVTWAGGGTIKWSGGAAPTATSASGKFDVYTFFSVDGTNTFGVDGGRNF